MLLDTCRVIANIVGMSDDRETILTKAAHLTGNRARAETWMREPIGDYGGHTPEDLSAAQRAEIEIPSGVGAHGQ